MRTPKKERASFDTRKFSVVTIGLGGITIEAPVGAPP
jgi:hypothetical protein